MHAHQPTSAPTTIPLSTPRAGPKVIKRQGSLAPADLTVGYHRLEPLEGEFMNQMSDRGLSPTVVYHNLSPAELYEKV